MDVTNLYEESGDLNCTIITDLERRLTNGQRTHVLTGDFNAHNAAWVEDAKDAKGVEALAWINVEGYEVVNDPTQSENVMISTTQIGTGTKTSLRQLANEMNEFGGQSRETACKRAVQEGLSETHWEEAIKQDGQNYWFDNDLKIRLKTGKRNNRRAIGFREDA